MLLTRIALQRSGKDFTIMKVLPSGVYQYRFLVDGLWKYAPDLPSTQDDDGNVYNILDLQVNITFIPLYKYACFIVAVTCHSLLGFECSYWCYLNSHI